MPLTCVHPHHHHAGTIRVDYTLLVSWKLASDLLDKRSHMGRVAFSVSVILLACCSNPERRWDTSDVQEELWCLTQTYRWISVAMGTQLTVVMNSSTWDVRRGVKGQTGTSWRVQWKKKKKSPSRPPLCTSVHFLLLTWQKGYGKCIVLSVPDQQDVGAS